MKLFSFRIQNFRSIIDTGETKISEIDNITILAGQNESGKTSVLEALEFFQKGAGPDFEENQRKLGTYPKVSCTFHLVDDELKEVEAKVNKKVASYIKNHGAVWYRGDTEKDDFGEIRFYTDEELNALLSEVSPPRKEAEQTESTDQETQEETVPAPFSAKDLESFLGPLRPEIILYSSFDNALLPAKIKFNEIDSNQAVKDFEKVFSIDFKELLSDLVDRSRQRKLETLNNQASENLNGYWTQKIGDEDTKYKYKVEAFPQETQDNSYIVFSIDRGNNEPLSLRQKSTGFRWFASFVLRLRAHEAATNAPGKLILLIDEPGQGLHEEAQKNVFRVLNEMSSNGWQVIYSTHLPQLLGGQDADLSRIKLVIMSKDEGSKVKNIAQATTDKGFRDALSPLRTAIGQLSLDVSSFLGGKKIIVVEGITDYYYLRSFVELHNLEEKYSFIPPVGASQISNIFAILYGWGVDPYAIFDGDRAGTTEYGKIKKAYFQNNEDEINKKVFKNDGCDGIEDVLSEDDFKKIADGLIDQAILESNSLNSKKAGGNKELVGRSFLDKIKSKEIKLENLSDFTKTNIEKIIIFLKMEEID